MGVAFHIFSTDRPALTLVALRILGILSWCSLMDYRYYLGIPFGTDTLLCKHKL
jgi:hypothetical protein